MRTVVLTIQAAVVVALGAIALACATTAEARGIPPLDTLDLRNAQVRSVEPHGVVQMPDTCHYSDIHAYSSRTGRAYLQRWDPRADGYEFYFKRGRKRVPVAGYDNENRTWYSFARVRSVTVVGFCELTD